MPAMHQTVIENNRAGEVYARMAGEPWTECSVVAQPTKPKGKKDGIGAPRVLVQRNLSDIEGPRGEQLLYLPGEPTISLFTGCGGMDIGTEAAGFCTLVQHEWSYEACHTLIANRPDFFRYSALIQGDICQTPTSMILREAGLRVGEAGLLTGGPPCQGFSIGGKRQLGDKRNDLVFQYLRVVREAQPKFFVFENVQGFVSFNDGSYMEAFLKLAHESYYELVYGLLDACDYGVPQRRTRFICMGTRRDLADCDGMIASLPEPTNFADGDLKLIRAAERLIIPDEYRRLTRPPGIRYFPDRPVLRPPAPNSGDGRSVWFQEFYDDLERREPDRIVRQPKGEC